jgi:hypothetical protein
VAMVGWRCGGRGGCGCGICGNSLPLLFVLIKNGLMCAYVHISYRYVPHEECLGNSIKYYLSLILLDVKQNLRC